jgi:hypothetical protein
MSGAAPDHKIVIDLSPEAIRLAEILEQAKEDIKRRMDRNPEALYIERRHNGKFAVMRGGSNRALFLLDSRERALLVARGIAASDAIYIERDRKDGLGR